MSEDVVVLLFGRRNHHSRCPPDDAFSPFVPPWLAWDSLRGANRRQSGVVSPPTRISRLPV